MLLLASVRVLLWSTRSLLLLLHLLLAHVAMGWNVWMLLLLLLLLWE